MKPVNSYWIPLLASMLFFSCSKKVVTDSLVITSISPTSGTSATIVTLTGKNFSPNAADDLVYFNGKQAAVLHASDTSMTVQVPVEAGTGDVKVSINGQTGTGPVFIYTGDSSYIVSTLAGNGIDAVVNGTGEAASFFQIESLAADTSGNLYVIEVGNQGIREVSPSGVVSYFVGSSTPGFADGTGAVAKFSYPTSVAIDANGYLYVADDDNMKIRKVSPGGIVTTFAGSTFGYLDAKGTAAQFEAPLVLGTDPKGNVFVFDAFNYLIRKITPDATVSTFMGAGSPGNSDGKGTSASLGYADGMCSDTAGNIYLADDTYDVVRKVTPDGTATHYAGSGTHGYLDGPAAAAKFWAPMGVASDRYGNIYVVDIYNGVVRKISSSGYVTTIAGIAGVTGKKDGPGLQATFNQPNAITIDTKGNIYIADGLNNSIRKLTPQ